MNFKKILSKKWSIAIIILLSAIVLLIIGVLITERLYYNRIYPGVYIGEINLAGKTIDEAEYYIQQSAEVLEDGLVFYYNNKELVVGPTITSFDIDLSYQIFSINPHQTALNAYAVGRNFNFLISLKDKLFGLFFHNRINLVVSINQEKLKELIKDNFKEFIIPVKNASLVKDKHNNFFVKAGQNGLDIDYDKVVKIFGKQLLKIDNSPIYLDTVTINPEIFKKDALNIDNQAKQILSLAPLVWKYEDKNWKIEEDKMSEWLDLRLIGKKKKKKVVVNLNKDAVKLYLKEKIAPEIDHPAIEAKFKMLDKKVDVFQHGQDGWEVDLELSAEKIINSIQEQKNEIFLIVNKTKALSDLAESEELGIKEIVGTGTSNFYGSPANRRHNIKVGAETLNGLLIKPGEEFSLMTVLGEIDGKAGYLPELVIRGNQTIPEFGGGLCQIGTTMFRTALETGLEITMRRNHSYRVSYYEPAGTDATIYDPWPDLKFINNLDSYILIQTRIEGNNLIFDFWGTKDGRVVEKSDPIIYNITEPEPTKIVETTDLKPGVKKCTEHAHNGADAYFNYNVTYANGEVVEKTFYSHYVPWQEVCLLGVEKISDDNTGIGVYEKMKDKINK